MAILTWPPLPRPHSCFRPGIHVAISSHVWLKLTAEFTGRTPHTLRPSRRPTGNKSAANSTDRPGDEPVSVARNESQLEHWCTPWHCQRSCRVCARGWSTRGDVWFRSEMLLWNGLSTLYRITLIRIMSKIQSIPGSKHTPSRLYKPVS
jgi:hypothetical protein